MSTSKNSIFWIKLTHWEYWPWYIVYIPIFIYWLWSGLRVRAIFYISAANPGFEYGGIVGSSKKEILDKIPEKYVPNCLVIDPSESQESVIRKIELAGLNFPLIAKPDIGERGFNVELVQSTEGLLMYRNSVIDRLILQEYINLPLEAGIFYYRLPNEENGVVSSIVVKGMLTVTGDGSRSIIELMQQSDRAKIQIERLIKTQKVDLNYIPDSGEEVLLEPIGNHNRGTAFLDGSNLITPELTKVIDTLSKQIDGFYYGRYDIRCKDEAALLRGEFKVIELNGSASEPAHIYSPGYPLLKGYKVLFRHWRILFKISKINHQRGVPYMSFKTGWGALKKSRFTKG